jgi:hypothetical protein
MAPVHPNTIAGLAVPLRRPADDGARTSNLMGIALAGLLVALGTGYTDASVSPGEKGAAPNGTPRESITAEGPGVAGPGASSPSATTAPAASVPVMHNGRIQGVEDSLARVRPACDDCSVHAGAFDRDTGALLVTSGRAGSGRLVGLSVVGADGLLAELSCPDDFACGGTTERPRPWARARKSSPSGRHTTTSR